MNSNPYRSPVKESSQPEVTPATKYMLPRKKLIRIAWFQKGLILCICLQLFSYLGVSLGLPIPRSIGIILICAMTIFGLASTGFVAAMAFELYGIAQAIIYGIASLIPCIGLLILLSVNSGASTLLKENGIKVGLLGANLEQI